MKPSESDKKSKFLDVESFINDQLNQNQIISRNNDSILKYRQFAVNGFIIATVFAITFFIWGFYGDQSFKGHEFKVHKQHPKRILAYTTQQTRLGIISQYCASNAAASFTTSQNSTNAQYTSMVDPYLQANASSLMINLEKGQFSSMLVEIQTNGISSIVFVAPFIIGLIILLFIWPFLICCCCCSENCPVQCCRDKRNPSYSTGELLWPTITLFIVVALAISAAIPTLTTSYKYFDKMSCYSARFVDNALNGNVTADGSYFFSGINTLRDQLINQLSPNLATIKTQITRLYGTQLTQTDTNAAAALLAIKGIPKSDYTIFTQTYSYPIESSSSTDTMTTAVGPIVGVYTNSSTLTGDLFTYVTQVQSDMNTIKTAATNAQPYLTSAGMGADITTLDGFLASTQIDLTAMQTLLQGVLLKYMSMLDTYNSSYLLPLYGAVIGVSVLIIVGIAFIKCLGMVSCRYFLYVVCFFTFFLCLACFIIAVILGISVPFMRYGCNYLSTSLNTTSQTSSFLSNLGFTNLAANMQQCYGGTYDFVTPLVPTLGGGFLNLKTAIKNSNSYNFTATAALITSKLSTFSSTINSYGLGQAPDFNPSSALGAAEMVYFNQVANFSAFPSCSSGSYSLMYTDIWAPSTVSTYTSYVSCGGKVAITASTCPSGMNVSCPTSRCLDTYSFLRAYFRNSSAAQITTGVNTRYGTTCASFNNYLTNFYSNYVLPVQTNIGNTIEDSSDPTKLAGRYSTASTSVTTLSNYLSTNVQTLYGSVNTNLQGISASALTPTTGVLDGLDCRLLYQDLINIKNAFCISSFNSFFFSLVTVGIMSFSLLFALCCIVCVAVRHHQQSLLTGKKNNKKEVIPIDLNDTAMLKI